MAFAAATPAAGAAFPVAHDPGQRVDGVSLAKIPSFEESYPKYEFAPLVKLGIYLADESKVRRHAAYPWAFLVACGGAAMVLLGISAPAAEGK